MEKTVIDILQENNKCLQEELFKSWVENKNISMRNYKILRDIKGILKDRDTSFMETYNKLDEYIERELKEYELF